MALHTLAVTSRSSSELLRGSVSEQKVSLREGKATGIGIREERKGWKITQG